MRSLFLSLLRSGLWGQQTNLPVNTKSVDWEDLLQISQDQTVVGVITDGIKNNTATLQDAGIAPARPILLKFIAGVLDIEQHNFKMNEYLFILMRGLKEAGVTALVVKGQGIGQNYVDPNHRASGDIDLLVRREDYLEAKEALMPFIDNIDSETPRLCHLAASKSSLVVELHGTLLSDIKNSIDRRVAAMQEQMFVQREFTLWENVSMPSDEFNAVFIFTHILQHFFKGGIGFRQICDWCRFLYVHNDGIDRKVLKEHLSAMHIMSEWQAFGNMAVRYLGIPESTMPFYRSCDRRGDKVLNFLFESGNFGRLMARDASRDTSYIRKKWNSLILSLKNFFSKVTIFPMDTFISYIHYLSIALGKMTRGK